MITILRPDVRSTDVNEEVGSLRSQCGHDQLVSYLPKISLQW